jgi:hypothetical protein
VLANLRVVVLAGFVGVASSFLSAQAVDASLCDILASPQSFDGKIVRIKGTVIAGFDEFAVKAPGCRAGAGAIWLSYPEGTRAKAGPAAAVQLQLARNAPATVANPGRQGVKLETNKDFKLFDSLLSTPHKSGGMCLGCVRYAVTATLVGRLDGASDTGVMRDKDGKAAGVSGFGNLNRYNARLVLQSVADVAPQEIDYTGDPAAAKDDSPSERAGDNPVEVARQMARAFKPGSAAGKELFRAAAAYGEAGEDNGVEIGFGAFNRTPKNDGLKGDQASPDGLLFYCWFDMDRLKGASLARAIVHVGAHIADIRDPQAAVWNRNAYELEYHAWQTTVLSAIAARQKTLTLPGGYLAWNSAWPEADRSRKAHETIAKFLADWESLSAPAQ